MLDRINIRGGNPPRSPADGLPVFVAAFQTIRSDKHSISSLEIRKVGLCAFDNKRHLLDDGITSYSYGHYKIAEST